MYTCIHVRQSSCFGVFDLLRLHEFCFWDGSQGLAQCHPGGGRADITYVHFKEIVYKQILIWFSLNAGFFLPVSCVSDNFNPGRSSIIHPSPNNKYKALWSAIGKRLHWLLELFQVLCWVIGKTFLKWKQQKLHKYIH